MHQLQAANPCHAPVAHLKVQGDPAIKKTEIQAKPEFLIDFLLAF